MTAKEMQRLSAQKRWGEMTPEQRGKIMSRVRAGEKKKRKQEMKTVEAHTFCEGWDKAIARGFGGSWFQIVTSDEIFAVRPDGSLCEPKGNKGQCPRIFSVEKSIRNR